MLLVVPGFALELTGDDLHDLQGFFRIMGAAQGVQEVCKMPNPVTKGMLLDVLQDIHLPPETLGKVLAAFDQGRHGYWALGKRYCDKSEQSDAVYVQGRVQTVLPDCRRNGLAPTVQCLRDSIDFMGSHTIPDFANF